MAYRSRGASGSGRRGAYPALSRGQTAFVLRSGHEVRGGALPRPAQVRPHHAIGRELALESGESRRQTPRGADIRVRVPRPCHQGGAGRLPRGPAHIGRNQSAVQGLYSFGPGILHRRHYRVRPGEFVAGGGDACRISRCSLPPRLPLACLCQVVNYSRGGLGSARWSGRCSSLHSAC